MEQKNQSSQVAQVIVNVMMWATILALVIMFIQSAYTAIAFFTRTPEWLDSIFIYPLMTPVTLLGGLALGWIACGGALAIALQGSQNPQAIKARGTALAYTIICGVTSGLYFLSTVVPSINSEALFYIGLALIAAVGIVGFLLASDLNKVNSENPAEEKVSDVSSPLIFFSVSSLLFVVFSLLNKFTVIKDPKVILIVAAVICLLLFTAAFNTLSNVNDCLGTSAMKRLLTGLFTILVVAGVVFLINNKKIHPSSYDSSYDSEYYSPYDDVDDYGGYYDDYDYSSGYDSSYGDYNSYDSYDSYDDYDGYDYY